MKWLFPKPDEMVICHKCKNEIRVTIETAEDGDGDFPWCDHCIDYCSGVIEKRPTSPLPNMDKASPS